MKQKCEKMLFDNHKQVRSSRHNDRVEQWFMDRSVKVEVLGSILGSQKKSFFPCLTVSVMSVT